MKLKTSTLLFIFSQFLFLSTAQAFIGFGLNVIQDQGSIGSSTDDNVSGTTTARMIREGFSGGIGIGGYLYLDFIPVVDLEVDFELAGNTYDFNFQNLAGSTVAYETGSVPFSWIRTSTYVSARKELFDGTIPILGGIKLHAGGGLNFHKAFPLASITMMETILGDALHDSFTGSSMEDQIVDYINENAESTTGIHMQTGIQLNLLFLDTFINYRYSIGKTYEGSSGFGSLQLKVGMGF